MCSIVASYRSMAQLASVSKRTVLNRVVRRSVRANRPHLHRPLADASGAQAHRVGEPN